MFRVLAWVSLGLPGREKLLIFLQLAETDGERPGLFISLALPSGYRQQELPWAVLGGSLRGWAPPGPWQVGRAVMGGCGMNSILPSAPGNCSFQLSEKGQVDFQAD